MEVQYADRDLRDLCTDEKTMRRKRGDIADKLRLRVGALRTANSIADLVTLDPSGKWHQLTANRAGTWAGRLSNNWRLIIRPEGDSFSADAVEVTVIEITDYHSRKG